MYYFLCIVIISLTISWFDITTRRIPNMALGALLITGICFLLTADNHARVNGGVFIPLIVFSVGYVLSFANVIGMGDVKLLSIGLLLCPVWMHVDMLYFTFFIGGIWGILWHYLLQKTTIIKKIDNINEGIPYGIPVAVAMCIFTFVR
ncbi:A24 family peptidase [Enterobacter ludwigii]|uniref:A24 family peptidase n=1 Tax=Enterobacter ludwigii TaxID=299767 RepID=UPI0039760803